MPIKIDFLANTRDFLRGAGDVEEKFDDVADALDDLATDSRRSGEQLGDNIGDGAKDGEKAVDRLQRSFKEMADVSRKESKRAGDAVGDDVQRGTREAGEGLDELKDSGRSNAMEVAASFDGSAQSIADGFQGVAAEAFAGFGPAGLVAGLAAAAGIGLISSALEQGGEDSEAMKQKVADLTQELIDTKRGAPSLDYISSKIQELATETDDGAVSLKKLRDAADRSGSSYKDLAQAVAGNRGEIDKLIASGDERLKQLEREAASTDTSTDAGGKLYATLLDQGNAQKDYNQYLRDAKTESDQAAAAESNYLAAGGPLLAARAEAVSSIQSSVDDAAASWEDYKNTETGALDPAAYLAGVAARTQAANDYAANLAIAQTKLTPEAYQYLVDQGIDFAPMLQSILSGGGDLINQMNTQYTAAGKAGTEALKNNVPKTLPGPTITPQLDTADIDRQFESLLARQRGRHVTIVGDVVTKIGNQVY